MQIVNTQSLAATVDAVNEAFFLGRLPSKPQRRQAAKWIAGRQGKPGSYADMFAPTRRDRAQGIRLFTGERVVTGAATGHILGEEACRALILLDADAKDVGTALEAATAGMLARLRKERRLGMYCCGRCSASLWRHLAVGGLEQVGAERFLAAGVKKLKAFRDGKGRWRVFPFHYTLLALREIDLPAAVKEMRYAAPSLHRVLKRAPAADKYDRRRRVLAERILATC